MRVRIEVEVDSPEEIELVVKALNALAPKKKKKSSSSRRRRKSQTETPQVEAPQDTQAAQTTEQAAQADLPSFVKGNPWIEVLAKRK